MINIFFIGIIRIYQMIISPLFPRSCRFYPSCSEYSKQAFQSCSLPHAFFLSCWRILRCNPFNEGGYDPLDLRTQRKD